MNTKEQEEIWKPIEGYEGRYEISNLGRVKSFYREETILKPTTSFNGYYRLSIRINKTRKTIKVHRLVAKAFIPNPNNYPQVNHIDGNKKNNNLNNLEWCNSKMNIRHAYEIGLKKRKVILILKNGIIMDCVSGTNAMKEKGYVCRRVYECLSGKMKLHKGCTFFEVKNISDINNHSIHSQTIKKYIQAELDLC